MANKKVSQLSSKPSVLVTDLFPIADPSTGQLYKTTISDLGTAIGSGVSSVNTLVGAVVLDTDDIQELVSPTNKWFTDTRARAALSASSPLTYNSGTGVFSMPAATSSQNGYLTSTDWTTFNSKQTALSGTGFVKISGTTISYDNSTYLTTSAAASTYVSGTGATGYYARFTGTRVISDGFIQTTSNITYIEGMGLSTLNGLDITGNYGAGGGGLKIRSYDETTGNAYIDFANTGGRMYLGLNRSTASGLMTNASAYATVLTTGLGTTNLEFGTNATKRLTLDGTTGAATFTSSVTASALYVTGMTAGSGAIYHTGSRLTFANYNASGTLHFEVNGGAGALTLNADTSATFQAGASFGGALSGTSATFSSSIAASAIGINANAGTNAAKLFVAGTSSLYDSAGTRGISFFMNRSSVNVITSDYIGTSYLPISISARDNNGDLYLTTSGNVGINTTSPSSKLHVNGGLRLQNGSSDLTYYEEGTFTPGLTFGGGSTGMSFFDRAGVYTRIGRQVTCTIYLALTAKGSSTGDASLTGLPFTNGNYNRGSSSAASIRFDNITYSGDLQMILPASTNYISFEQVTIAGLDSRLTHLNFNDSTEMTITVTYFV